MSVSEINLFIPRQYGDIVDHDLICKVLKVDGNDGFVIESENVQKVLDSINAKESDLLQTDYSNLFIVKDIENFIKASKPTPEIGGKEVTVAAWEGSLINKDIFIKNTKEILSPVVDKDIIIDVVHCFTRKPPYRNRNKIYIYIWSAPPESIRSDLQVPEKIWGIGVNCRDCPYLPSSLSYEIYDSTTKYCVGEIFDDKYIYIFHDICHYGTADEVKLYCKFLQEVTKYYTIPEKDRIKLVKESILQGQNRLFISCMDQRICKLLNDYKKSYKTTTEAIANTVASLAENIKQKDFLSHSIEIYEKLNSTKHEDEWYLDELNKIRNHKRITNILITRTHFGFTTDIIYCEHPDTGKLYEIGIFDVTISYGSHIIFNNKTRKVNGFESSMNAPHVFKDGNACFGDISKTVSELLAYNELYLLVNLLINFLESVNTSDAAGKYLTKWPEVDPTTKKIIGQKETI